MNKRGRGISGQTQISFGMIFSVILIIAFIAFAVYGITKFLCVNKVGQVERFKSDFQGDINNMWRSTQGSQEVNYIIPRNIKQVCFSDGEFENMYFVISKSNNCGFSDGDLLSNVDIAKTIAGSTSRPKKLCIDSSDGKIYLTIKKAYNEDLVTITK
jgi:hypothetical protein